MPEKNLAKSASRALDLLVFFADRREAARAVDIAEALDLPRSSADQLLKTLVRTGYLTFQSGPKTYFPSPTLALFGEWIAQTYSRRAEFSAIMADVHDATGEAVTLTMQNDCFMQIVDCLGVTADIPPIGRGQRVPMVGSALGGAVLAAKSDREVNKVIARARRVRAAVVGPRDFDAFPEMVLSYRRAGYAWSRRAVGNSASLGTGDDLYSLAVPLPQAASMASMALGLAAPARRIIDHEREIAAQMKACIRRRLPDVLQPSAAG